MKAINDRSYNGGSYQHGSILVMALIMILVLSLVGVSAISSTNINLKIAENQQRQFDVQLDAENIATCRVANYPTATPAVEALCGEMVTGSTSISLTSESKQCVSQGYIEGTGSDSVNNVDCGWNETRKTDGHHSFGGSKNCQVGSYTSSWHPHLHHMSGNKELWINGDVTIEHCGGCFREHGSEINYTGSIINSCTKKGYSWPSAVIANKVTLQEFNLARGGTLATEKEYYSHIELQVTSIDEMSGAKASVVRGLKFRGVSSTSPSKADCGVGGDHATIVSDPMLTQVGQVRELYSYQVID